MKRNFSYKLPTNINSFISLKKDKKLQSKAKCLKNELNETKTFLHCILLNISITDIKIFINKNDTAEK